MNKDDLMIEYDKLYSEYCSLDNMFTASLSIMGVSLILNVLFGFALILG